MDHDKKDALVAENSTLLAKLEAAARQIAAYRSPGVAHNAASTLHKLCNNVLQHPSEPKFRSISLDNAAIRERVAAVVGGIAFLKAAGWLKDGCRMVIDAKDDATLVLAISVLDRGFSEGWFRSCDIPITAGKGKILGGEGGGSDESNPREAAALAARRRQEVAMLATLPLEQRRRRAELLARVETLLRRRGEPSPVGLGSLDTAALVRILGDS